MQMNLDTPRMRFEDHELISVMDYRFRPLSVAHRYAVETRTILAAAAVAIERIMADYNVHDPNYSGTTTDEWSAPQQEDFNTDDLSEIGGHFILSSSGFPPDDFTDLKLPVVDPSGRLNENALQAAHGGAHSVEAIDDIGDDTKQDVQNRLETLSQQEFDESIGN